MNLIYQYLIIIATVIAMIMPASAAHQPHDFEVKGLLYRIIGEHSVEVADVRLQEDSDTLNFSISEAIDEDMVCRIPSSVQFNDIDYNVNAIGNNAFAYIAHVEEIVIPQTVTRIGKKAFLKCFELRRLELPSGLKEIDEYAFACCTELLTLEIPQSVITLKPYAFTSSYFRSIVINAAITEIPDYLCYYAAHLTSIEINSPIKKICRYAFYNTKIESFEIPEGVEEISEFAFRGCGWWTECDGAIQLLHSITLPSTLKKMDTGAISGARVIDATKLTELPDNFVNGIYARVENKFVRRKSNDSDLPYYEDVPDQYIDFYTKPVKPVVIFADIEMADKAKESNELFFWDSAETRVTSDREDGVAYITEALGKHHIPFSNYRPIRPGNVFYSLPDDNIFIGILHSNFTSSGPIVLIGSCPFLKPAYFTEDGKRIGTRFTYKPANNRNTILIQYDNEFGNAGVTAAGADATALFDIYNLNGVKVASGVNAGSLRELPAGLYIISDGKTSRKIAL